MTSTQLITAARRAHYDTVGKEQFRRSAMWFLRQLRARLGATQTPRFNPGGVGVSGEAILHTPNVYVHIGEHQYWRIVSSTTGGTNRPIPLGATPATLEVDIRRALLAP